MSKVILVANQVENLVFEENVDYIGVDGGCKYCLDHMIPMVYAIGDFDSIDESLLHVLKRQTKTVQLPVNKDVSDGQYAIEFAHKLGYDRIVFVGGTGGRLDHFLALYHYMRTNHVSFILEDDKNRIYPLQQGKHQIRKNGIYISIFPCEPLTITIQGVKYPLVNQAIAETDASFTISNEIIDDYAWIETSGKLIIIESK